MNYQEALEYLHDLCKFGINLGMERIEKLLSLLGNPHLKIKTVHIAGTNGKGSTTAMIAGILQAAQYKVGVYTSPHLHQYTERIRINGIDIPSEDFARQMEKIKEIVPQVLEATGESPTEFEILTALAFDYFALQEVDIAVIEVGMGGRLDSTNVIKPLVSVLTSISTDHVNYLGPCLTDIAKEKAGIIKMGTPVVCALQESPVEEVIFDKAQSLEAPVYLVRDCSYKQTKYSNIGQSFDLSTPNKKYENLSLSLLGDHQLENAMTAVLTIEILGTLGWAIDSEQIQQGLQSVKWPGRLEYLKLKSPTLLDGAHNPAGAKVLAQAIPKYFQYERLIFVLGVLADKDKDEIINYLGPLGDVFIVTKPPNARAGHWDDLLELLKKYDKEIFLEENNEKAIDLAFRLSQNNDLVVITGSLYLLGESREYVLNNYSLT
ncbi:MAG: bifunctional folylpolyglutamate synthase/dihydrofolate synthase [Peptococcales bacterium]|jgi:dihydrofolate synthase/folylpolyglutamate synthase